MAFRRWLPLFVVLFSCTRYASAVPTSSFPVNAQVPPAARVGELFSYIFSPSTFTSTSAMTYTLDNAPRWLAVDSEARRLYGTPLDSDIGPGEVVGVPVGLVATDFSGSTTMSITLVVSRVPPPSLKIPLAGQPPSFGLFSGPDSIISFPDKPFTFTLAKDTFVGASQASLSYYAVTDDNSPLPAWLSFDAEKLAFAGTTPPLASLIQPPQSFGFQLVASDIVGFSAATLTFKIVVGSHRISANETSLVFNFTSGHPFSYSGLSTTIGVDGSPAKRGQLAITTGNMPSWLSLDQQSWNLSGTPPANANSTSFTISLTDMFSDTLNLTVSLIPTHQLTSLGSSFTGPLPELTVTPGHHFSVSLASYIARPQESDVNLSPSSLPDWIHYDTGQNVLSGDVPMALQDAIVVITLVAKARTSGHTDTASLSLRIQRAVSSVNDVSRTAILALSSTPGATVTTSGIAGSIPADDHADAPSHVVLIAILVPLLLLALALLLVSMCYLRRRQIRRQVLPSGSGISNPLPGSFVVDSPTKTNRHGTARKRFEAGTLPRPIYREASSSYSNLTSRHLSESDIPPMPDIAKVNAFKDKIRFQPSIKLHGSRRSWIVAGATGMFKPRKQAKRSKPRSYLSDMSLYNDPRGMAGKGPTVFRYGGGMSFRDAIETHVPTMTSSSIQHTPEMVYSGRTMSLSSQPDSCSFSGNSMDRSMTDLDGDFAPSPVASDGGASTLDVDRDAGFRQQHSLLSMSTCDISTSRNSSMFPDSPESGPSDEVVTHLPRVRLATAGEESISGHPLSRKSPETSRWFGSQRSFRRQHGKVMKPATRFSATVDEESAGQPIAEAPLALSTIARRSSTRDSLGILYSDLIKNSPFHPSRGTRFESAQSNGVVRFEVDSDCTQPPGHDGLLKTTSSGLMCDESPIIKDWGYSTLPPSNVSTRPPRRRPQAMKASPHLTVYHDPSVDSRAGGVAENGSRRRNTKPIADAADGMEPDHIVYI